MHLNGAFLGAFGGEFSFAFVFTPDVERREVVIVLLGGIVRDGLLSGSASEARRGRTRRAAAGRLA